jgi:hypothetical protein
LNHGSDLAGWPARNLQRVGLRVRGDARLNDSLTKRASATPLQPRGLWYGEVLTEDRLSTSNRADCKCVGMHTFLSTGLVGRAPYAFTREARRNIGVTSADDQVHHG